MVLSTQHSILNADCSQEQSVVSGNHTRLSNWKASRFAKNETAWWHGWMIRSTGQSGHIRLRASRETVQAMLLPGQVLLDERIDFLMAQGTRGGGWSGEVDFAWQSSGSTDSGGRRGLYTDLYGYGKMVIGQSIASGASAL